MTRAEKSKKLKEDIVAAANELMLAQGYQKTTIRQIAGKVGVNLGSLYHFFKNKEDIFKQLTIRTYKDLIEYSEKIMPENQNPLFRYAIFRAIEMKVVEQSDRLAELYGVSYSSWAIGKAILKENIEQKRKFFHHYNPAFTDKDYYTRALALRGIRYAFFLGRYHEGPDDLEGKVAFYTQTALSMFNVPDDQIEAVIPEILHTISRIEIDVEARNYRHGLINLH